MGAQQSSASGLSAEQSEKVFYPESQAGTVQFSPELVAQLSDSSNSTNPSEARQSSLDDHIRSKLASSLASLKQQEAQLTSQLQASLSQSNTAHESSSSSSGTSSQLLSRDIDEVREKVRRIENKKSLADWPEVTKMKDNVRECYLKNPNSTLDCWREAEDFKAAVAKLESHFVSTLR